MNLPYTCQHENDDCTTILVARPHYRSILIANENIQDNLYREKVAIKMLHEHHEHLIETLTNHGVRVHDIMCSLTDHSVRNDLGNMIFTRDPILCTARGVVLGRFREPVRRMETELVSGALAQLKVPILGKIRSPGYVEGGDFIPAGERAFIAVGNRTNIPGVEQMLQNDWFGTEYVAIVEYPEDGQMKAIHLDCYLGIVGRKHAVVWKHALEVATVTEMRRLNRWSLYETTVTGIPLAHYLTDYCGYELIVVNDHSQSKYACNLLDIGHGCVLTQEEFVTQELLARGYHTIFIPFHEVHKMYGGIRCATQTVQRIPNVI
jgi:arginine deiminase